MSAEPPRPHQVPRELAQGVGQPAGILPVRLMRLPVPIPEDGFRSRHHQPSCVLFSSWTISYSSHSDWLFACSHRHLPHLPALLDPRLPRRLHRKLAHRYRRGSPVYRIRFLRRCVTLFSLRGSALPALFRSLLNVGAVDSLENIDSYPSTPRRFPRLGPHPRRRGHPRRRLLRRAPTRYLPMGERPHPRAAARRRSRLLLLSLLLPLRRRMYAQGGSPASAARDPRPNALYEGRRAPRDHQHILHVRGGDVRLPAGADALPRVAARGGAEEGRGPRGGDGADGRAVRAFSFFTLPLAPGLTRKRQLIVVGVVKSVRQTYHGVKWLTRIALSRVEDLVIEVNA